MSPVVHRNGCWRCRPAVAISAALEQQEGRAVVRTHDAARQLARLKSLPLRRLISRRSTGASPELEAQTQQLLDRYNQVAADPRNYILPLAGADRHCLVLGPTTAPPVRLHSARSSRIRFFRWAAISAAISLMKTGTTTGCRSSLRRRIAVPLSPSRGPTTSAGIACRSGSAAAPPESFRFRVSGDGFSSTSRPFRARQLWDAACAGGVASHLVQPCGSQSGQLGWRNDHSASGSVGQPVQS